MAMTYNKLWPRFALPWISFAVLWAEIAPYAAFPGPYLQRLLFGILGGFVAAGLGFIVKDRLMRVVLQRLHRVIRRERRGLTPGRYAQ